VLHDLYRDKQRELDLQLTLIGLRGARRFMEASRLLYGPVEPELLAMAEDVLSELAARSDPGGDGGHADCHDLRTAAQRMAASYRAAYPGFAPTIDIRDDIPAGVMVSGPCLMIARSTRTSRRRVEPLLHHEVGVHLLTYFAGDAQGLRLFRSGLAGYEGVQEGLAVFAEYLAGGLTPARLRLIAGRVVGCAAMLDGADFPETYRRLADDHGFSPGVAFNLTLRLHRSGGLSKDAIYLRGLRDVLAYVGAGRSLTPFWSGKIAMEHVPVVEELAARGLLRAPPVTPAFLDAAGADRRMDAARRGLSPIDLVAA
jgi:uncharacterized protein (TIGR02421 family)